MSASVAKKTSQQVGDPTVGARVHFCHDRDAHTDSVIVAVESGSDFRVVDLRVVAANISGARIPYSERLQPFSWHRPELDDALV
jgi:hypothetical protein